MKNILILTLLALTAFSCKSIKTDSNEFTDTIEYVFKKELKSESLMAMIIVDDSTAAKNLAITYLNNINKDLDLKFEKADPFKISLINNEQIWMVELDKTNRFRTNSEEKALIRYYVFISRKDGALILYKEEDPHFYGDTERLIKLMKFKK